MHGWEVGARRSKAPLRLADKSPLAKVLVRADADGGVARSLRVSFGCSARDDHDVLVIGSGPGEWSMLGAPGTAAAITARLEQVPDDGLVSVFDETHGRALLRIGGATASDVLSKLCAIDLSDNVTPDGTAFRSSLARVVTDVVRDDADGERSYLLGCERSYGRYLFDALIDAGAEYGVDVDGSLYPGV